MKEDIIMGGGGEEDFIDFEKLDINEELTVRKDGEGAQIN